MTDWSILQPTPNFAQAALSGWQAGRQMQKQARLDNAMQGIDLDRPESLLPLLRADPATGSALIGISERRQQQQQEMQRQKHVADTFSTLMGAQNSAQPASQQGSPMAQGSAPSASASPPALPSQANMPDAGAQDGSSNDITVTGGKPNPDLSSAISMLSQAGANPSEVEQFVKLSSQMTKAHADALSAQQNALGTIAASIPPEMPMDQRMAFIQQNRDYLLSHGVPAEKVDSFVPTDQNLSSVKAMALGVEKALQATHQERTFAETQRHNRVDESQGAARIAISGGELHVHQGALGLAQQKEGRVAGKAASSPNPSGLSTADLINMANGGH